MRTKNLNRRTFLRGALGASVALPWLDIMGSHKAEAQTGGLARYFVVAYGGISLGRYNEYITPSAAGADYAATVGLRPLFGNSLADSEAARHDYASVKDEFSVVSGLFMPWDGSGPGRRGDQWHGCTMCPQLSGISITGKDSPLLAPSSDFLVHRAIGGDKRHLRLRVQATDYRGNPNGSRGRLSAGLDDNGDLVHYVPISSPLEAHRSLFQDLSAAPDDTGWQRLHAERRSVLDLVRGSAERLERRLGTADRRRLERHFDEIRDLEQRIASLSSGEAVGACSEPAEPAEPSIGSEWSDETTRAEIMSELTYLAIACDLTASVNLQMTYTSCYMSAEPITGDSLDVHETGHSGSDSTNMAQIYAWHIRPLAKMVDRLRASPSADGGSLLDQTAVVFVNEAGFGDDESFGDLDHGSHSSRNMIALVAGRAGGHRPGRHIHMNNDVHPSSAIVAAMQMVGVSDPLGEITEGIPELFT